MQRQKALLVRSPGLPNRAAWSERLDHEVKPGTSAATACRWRCSTWTSFSGSTDGYGHLAGGRGLKIIADVLRKRLRSTDFIRRAFWW